MLFYNASMKMAEILKGQIGIEVPLSITTFLYLEFRAARHFFSIVNGTAFSKEKDRFTLQTFQVLLGTWLMFP